MTSLRLFVACIFCLLQGVGFSGNASAARTYTISGYVWTDASGDGLLSIWEQKFPGATVKLMKASSNTVITTATANAAGNYTIANVPPGNYRVTLKAISGYATPAVSAITVTGNIIRHLAISKLKSPEESALNAFGDRWSLAKPNPSLPRAAATGCYRRPPPGVGPGFTPEELQFFKRLAAPFYLEGCAVLLETNPPFDDGIEYATTARLEARVAQFKAANPSLKYVGSGRVTEWNVGVVGWYEIYQHKEWFLYKNGSTTQTEDNIVLALNGAWILDITNPDFQDYIAGRIAEALTHYGIDGLVLDNVAAVPRLSDPSTLPENKRVAWQGAWLSLLAKIKAAVGPTRYLFANVPRDDVANARLVIPLVDGVMVEDTFSPVKKDIAARVALEQPIFNAAANAGKWIITTENTMIDGSAFATTTPAKEHALERTYLAAFYIFNKGKMLFYYNPPAPRVPQYGAEAFFSDWNIKVGTPSGAYAKIAGHPRVYRRNYTNAVIYLNNSASKFVVAVPAGSEFKFDPDRKAITSYVMQPFSGFILSRAQAFQ